MAIKKNKIVFAGIILCVVLFIGSYTFIVISDHEKPIINGNQIPVPKLQDSQKEYKSKLEALEDIKEIRQNNAPSVYDERLLDSTGIYDPDLLDKEKMRIVDSIYSQGKINYSEESYRKTIIDRESKIEIKEDIISNTLEEESLIDIKEMGLGHQLFFTSNPVKNSTKLSQITDSLIIVRVDGTQTVKQNHRLQMRLMNNTRINGEYLPRNSLIYGFIKFQPNRTLISIEHINHQVVKLSAHDFQDGNEGIYIENSFRSEVRQQLINDAINDINITGVPQVSGVKKIFQRNNRNVKVTIADNYQLILKLKE